MIRRGNSFTRCTIFGAKYACNESSKATFGKGTQWRQRSSYAASVPSDIPKAPKRCKRVPKDERQVMVESFVKKYREEHGGKFPHIDLTRKEVGGSYYIIRQMVQELEYKSKIPTEGVTTDVQTQSDQEVLARSDVKDDSTDKQEELVEESRVDVHGAQNYHLERDTKDSTHARLGMTDNIKQNNAHLQESHFDDLEVQNHLLENNYKDSYHPYPETTEDGKLNNAHLQESRGAVLEAQNSVLENNVNSSYLCPETIESGKLNDSHLQESHGDVFEARNCAMEKDSKDSSHLCPETTDEMASENAQYFATKDQHDYSDIVPAESHQDNREILSETFCNAKDNQKEHGESVDSVDLKKMKNDGSPQLATDLRENTTGQTDAEISKRSTLWDNLKTFADGIINIWRKR